MSRVQGFLATALLTVVAYGLANAEPAGNGSMVCPAMTDTNPTAPPQLWGFNPDGSGKRQLTSAGANATPSFSPDGKRLYFFSNRTGNNQIWVMGPDGSHQRQLTFGSDGDALTPQESPDGTKLAFASSQGGLGHPEIFIMNSDGTGLKQLTQTPVAPQGQSYTWSLHPSWSPDGQKITYASTKSGSTQVWVMDADGSNRVQLTSGLGENFPDANVPSYSPDGRQIVFWSGFEKNYGDIWVMNADGSSPRKLTTTPAPRSADNPVWSPDGTKVIFDSNRDGALGIWMVDVSGSEPILVAHGFGTVCAWQPVL